VRELSALLDQPQNLVSYHLGRLRAAEFVAMRRSSADARDTYYRIDLERCGDLLSATGAALHPGLNLQPPRSALPPTLTLRATVGTPPRVLFLCTGNSARSQMAEAMLERAAQGAVIAASAGSQPKPLHPYAVEAMRRRGIDLRGRRSKHFLELEGHFDYVVSLCDRVREVCPEFPESPRLIHWSIPDPGREELPVFEDIAEDLEGRIRFLLARIEQEVQQS
jgi:protein-tyrosine-phosphatase